MCVACSEYIKNKLTSLELKAALKEVALDNPAHQQQVEELMKKYPEPEDLKKALKPLNTSTKDYDY